VAEFLGFPSRLGGFAALRELFFLDGNHTSQP
jgi:hypothetical protein